MNTKVLLYILLLQCIFANATYSQIFRDTILYEGKSSDYTPYYFINDRVCYKWAWDKKQEMRLSYRDTLLLLSNTLKSADMSVHFMNKSKNKLYFGGLTYYSLDFSNDSLTVHTLSYEHSDNFVMVDGKLYFSNDQTLYIQDLTTGKMIDSLVINKKVRLNSDDYILEIIKFSNTNNIILMMGYYDGGMIENEQYCIYNEASKKCLLAPNNDLIKKIIEPNSAIVRCYDLSMQYIFLDESIFDSNFSLFSKFKNFIIDIFGVVIARGEIKQLIIRSYLDLKDGEKEKTEVLIPFIPDPFKEKTMYEIYENIELKAQDLQRFDTFDLRLLRNMVFAKHNYAFKDKFLQAYFNLYSFYGYKKERLTDINHLLTVVDKKNLELIQQASKNKN